MPRQFFDRQPALSEYAHAANLNSSLFISSIGLYIAEAIAANRALDGETKRANCNTAIIL